MALGIAFMADAGARLVAAPRLVAALQSALTFRWHWVHRRIWHSRLGNELGNAVDVRNMTGGVSSSVVRIL